MKTCLGHEIEVAADIGENCSVPFPALGGRGARRIDMKTCLGHEVEMAAGIGVNGSVSHVPLATGQRVLCSHVQERTNEMEQSVAMNGYKPKGLGSRNGAQTGVGPLPLSGLSIGEEGVVVRLNGNRRSRLKLSSLGIVPGAGVVLEQRRPTLLFRMGRSRFAVDEDLGSAIQVRSTRR